MESWGIEVGNEDAVVVYAGRTGEILHAHHFVTAKGGAHPDKEARERQALESATQGHRALPEGVQPLHVDMRAVKSGVNYKVDVEKQVLVEVRSKR